MFGETKAERAIKEVHEGACKSHIGGRALASKIAHRSQASSRNLNQKSELVIMEPNLHHRQWQSSVHNMESNSHLPLWSIPSQAEVANRVILRELYKWLEEAKGR
ncbi:hypothetical protein CR513_24274, partial [Mucuna pruriens]